jgi:hypothetical protein
MNEDGTAKMYYERLDEDKAGGLRSLLQKRKKVYHLKARCSLSGFFCIKKDYTDQI